MFIYDQTPDGNKRFRFDREQFIILKKAWQSAHDMTSCEITLKRKQRERVELEHSRFSPEQPTSSRYPPFPSGFYNLLKQCCQLEVKCMHTAQYTHRLPQTHMRVSGEYSYFKFIKFCILNHRCSHFVII